MNFYPLWISLLQEENKPVYFPFFPLFPPVSSGGNSKGKF